MQYQHSVGGISWTQPSFGASTHELSVQ
ncbi:hypothetical protein PPSIR1_22129 [Plesiocystis pacifica SIR-1]|uniref:Uncharacterized protein n=1 Tax=Plesiocystis pacifica SIR-1 TaxID=391625 RepID=A6FXS3_9BACT|nr:hypothetical protein PPSIR1_22129 [Plesiocystis pacifica SIR-1]